MLRRLHSLPGLFAALFLIVLATSGAVLSLSPALERAVATVPPSGAASVAEVAARVLAQYPATEQIERLPSGAVLVYFSQDGNPAADIVDPLTGIRISAYEPSPIFAWIKDLHRSFLLDDIGRGAAGILALLMVVMCFSGTFLLAYRAGGWRHLFSPIRGTGSQRLHTQIARYAVLGLLVSSLTGVWMSAIRFELVTEAEEVEALFPEEVSGGTPTPVGTLNALRAVDLQDLHQLVFPFPDDPNDVYSLRTHQGSGYIDQETGELLSYSDYGSAASLQTFIVELHTGEAFWYVGLILGLAVLMVPVLSVTGVLIWWQRRRALPRLVGNTSAQSADTVILVGSETNTTWGFAKTLHDGLTAAGYHVHTAPMNRLEKQYRKARRLFILAATYGDGAAPASATQFLDKLAKVPDSAQLPWAVLGFGDRQFPSFCAFANEVTTVLRQRGWPQLLETELIDRQSAQTFERWAAALGNTINTPLTLRHVPLRRRTTALLLTEREDFGVEVLAPTSILRFHAAKRGGPLAALRRLLGWSGLPSFEAGDLVGILPPGSDIPRFYSLASASREGVLEICVRRQERGVCSSFLCSLQPEQSGQEVRAFIQYNPLFRPARGKQPVILIGAGTGIAPLVGFIRHNRSHKRSQHPMYLYWGGRSPQSDYLYERDLQSWLQDDRLTGLQTAFSRGGDRAYVQDKLKADAVQVRALLEQGGQVLVCGGRNMAADVAKAMDEILAPLSLSVAGLKAAGRYLEDTY
ncbi:MAG: PepSY domain-containing protein [Gammaproteobacteria bacterium]|nr:PepSY domain-containing protein [Gammaproteobacteria bacterium]